MCELSPIQFWYLFGFRKLRRRIKARTILIGEQHSMRLKLTKMLVIISFCAIVLFGCSKHFIRGDSCVEACINSLGVIDKSNSDSKDSNVVFRIILTGDAGKIDENGSLKTQLPNWSLGPEKTRIVFLGDNVYDRGIRKGHELEDNKILQYQLDLGSRKENKEKGVEGVENPPKIFVPGNHDWDLDGKDGFGAIMRQQKYIEDKRHNNIAEFHPKNGCPGPEVINFSTNSEGNSNFKDFSLVAIDTQWLLYRNTKWRPSGCKITENKFLSELEDTLERLKDRHVVIVAHHPLMTTGKHGGFEPGFLGYFLSRGNVLYSKLFNRHQDIYRPRYRKMVNDFNNIFRKTRPLIYAAGHDHSLQIMRTVSSAQYTVVSGAGTSSKVEDVTSNKNTIYARATENVAGFMVLDLVREGDTEKVILRVVNIDDAYANENTADFSMQLLPRNNMDLPWLGEQKEDAQALFIDGIGRQKNWSGAHWNDLTQTLWLVNNRNVVRSYRLERDKFVSPENFEVKGDLEGITQTDKASDSIFVLAEKSNMIRQFRVTETKPVLVNSWSFAGHILDNETMEGLVFIPNEFLTDKKHSGELFSKSTSALGGIFFVSNQNNGGLYALELNENSSDAKLIGRYTLPTKSTRGLEFDKSHGGTLHFLDGTHWGISQLSSSEIPENIMPKVDGLNSLRWRKMNVNCFGMGPGPEGAEGIALVNSSSGAKWVVVVDDDNRGLGSNTYNAEGNRGVVLYKEYNPTVLCHQ